VGYSESSKAYIIYILEQHNIEASRDVTFNEKMAFKKSIEETMKSMKSLLKKARVFQKVGMKKKNNLIIQCNHVRPLIQTLYPKPRND
jgi:hypothetical protein